MKLNISNLWLLVLFALLATVAACAGNDKLSSGSTNTTAQAPPTRASPSPPVVAPTKSTQQGVTSPEGSILSRIVENYAAPSTNPKTGSPETINVSGNPEASLPGKIKFSEAVGKQAPDFALESLKDGTIKLSSYRGKNVVLFFTEGTMCYPACWDQMAQFGSDERFNNKDAIVFSIGVNPRSEWEKIIRQAPQVAKAPILIDITKAVSSTYDVLFLKSSMHPGDLPGHTYFVIDREGIIRFAFDDVDMGIRNDKLAEELKKLAP